MVKKDWIKTLNPKIYDLSKAGKCNWTEEQWEERARIIRESTIPLAGQPYPDGNGWIGYVCSREMIADICAADLYKWRKMLKKLQKDIDAGTK